jgi:putative transposase
MITRELKLKLNKTQEAKLNEWLWILTGVHNWAIKKIENDAKDKIYHTKMTFQNILANHSVKLGIPSHTIQGILSQVHDTWGRCFKKKGGQPKFKSNRKKLNSIPFPDPINNKFLEHNHIKIVGIGRVKFHKQDIPEGKIKCSRIIKRASGWYLILTIDANRAKIIRKSSNIVGIDPGFNHLLTLSNGIKIPHPRELEASAKRLAQSQRGKNKKLTARLHEHVKNQRKNRNHHVSLKLVQENIEIYFSKDNIKGIAKKFGKSVASSSHAQLRSMISYKSLCGGTKYVEVASKNSTRICSNCEALTGPTGWSGLSVRNWTCMECGASHDRDVNAAKNTVKIGVGATHEIGVKPSPKSGGNF